LASFGRLLIDPTDDIHLLIEGDRRICLCRVSFVAGPGTQSDPADANVRESGLCLFDRVPGRAREPLLEIVRQFSQLLTFDAAPKLDPLDPVLVQVEAELPGPELVHQL